MFAYTILRRIPSKRGGVIALFGAVVVLYLIPLRRRRFHLGMAFYPLAQIYFWVFVRSLLILTFVGMRPVAQPYILLGQIRTGVYFSYYPFHSRLERIWDLFIRSIQWALFQPQRHHSGSLFYDGARSLQSKEVTPLLSGLGSRR